MVSFTVARLVQQTQGSGAAGSDSIGKMLPWIGVGIVAVVILLALTLFVRAWMLSEKPPKGVDLATELQRMRQSMTPEEYEHVRSQMIEKIKAGAGSK